jgi:putative inorganic carbon (HCO3(-)) transporter
MLALRNLLRLTVPWHWLPVLLLAPVALTARADWLPLLLLIPVLALLRMVALDRPIPATPLNPALLLLVVMMGVSLWATPDLPESVPKVIGLAYGIALFWTIVDAVALQPRQTWLVVTATVSATFALAVIGALGSRTTLSRIPGFRQIADGLPLQALFESSVNPNQVGGVLTWLIPLLVALGLGAVIRMWYPSGKGLLIGLIGISPVIWGMVLVSLVILWFTRSRSSMIAVAVALVVVVGFGVSRFRPILLLYLTAVLIAAGALFFYRDQLPVIANIPTEESAIVSSLAGRIEIWSRAVYGLQDFPFTGMGMNMFRRVVHILYPLFLISPTTDIAHAHNQFLQAGLDLGIPGMIAWLAVWLGSAMMLWYGWKGATTIGQRALLAGLGGVWAGHLVYGMTDAIALGAKPGFVLWMLFGILTGLHRQIADALPRPVPVVPLPPAESVEPGDQVEAAVESGAV